MSRFLRTSLVSVIALAVMLAVMPAPASARVFIRGGYWAGPGWGWGPGYYAGWGPGYYYAPNHGTVKIVNTDKQASVFIDGGYAGTVKEMHKFPLRPGTHDVSVREPNGQTLYNQRVEVLRGKTIEIHPGA